MTHPLDQQLRHLGIDPDALDPEVLAALRAAAPAPTDPLEAAYTDAILEPPDAAERAAAQAAFSRDVAAYLGSGTDLDDRHDLETGHTA